MHRVSWGRWQVLSALVAALALLGSAQVHAAERVKRVAVLTVGVEEYKNVNPLLGAVNDAKGVEERFRATAESLKVPAADLWVRSLSNGTATRQAVLDGLRAVSDKSGPDTLTVIFLAGHGERRGGDWWFVPYDYNFTDDRDSGITSADVLSAADAAAGKGSTVLVILDACFAAEFRNRADKLLAKYQEEGKGGIVILASSVPSQVSIGSSDHGFFTGVLLEGLWGAADLNRDGAVTLKEARRYLSWRLPEQVRSGPRPRGLDWPEQDFVCDYSLSVSESLPLAAGNMRLDVRLLPSAMNTSTVLAGTGAEFFMKWPWLKSPLRTPGLLASADLAGAWRAEWRLVGADGKPLLDRDGKPLLRVYRLVFEKPNDRGRGLYTAEFSSGFGERQQTTGQYSFREYAHVTGPTFLDRDPSLVLEYANGTDYLGLLRADKDEIRFTASVADYFIWEKARMAVETPILRKDYDPVPAKMKNLVLKKRGEQMTTGDFRAGFGYIVKEPESFTLRREKSGGAK